jgi:hypothetical protein
MGFLQFEFLLCLNAKNNGDSPFIMLPEVEEVDQTGKL